jgi:hypothetical protein
MMPPAIAARVSPASWSEGDVAKQRKEENAFEKDRAEADLGQRTAENSA